MKSKSQSSRRRVQGCLFSLVTVGAAVFLCLPWMTASPVPQSGQPDDSPKGGSTEDQAGSSGNPRKEVRASGGEKLSSKEVADLPLNKRDFSQLLLLAAGTMTDANGAANFTQQFAVNGQRGSTTVFAMDGIDTTDPEMGGATFSNFNVDAIQEIRSLSGVMPAEIGHGAAGYTETLTKPGTATWHGSVFEFARNAAFDARNFFDRRTLASPGRIPPFTRNEFGFTVGGPLVIPGLYDGRNRSFLYGQYQGFRQVLGTTQVLSVPSQSERQGIDTTAIPGDSLRVSIQPSVAAVLARYPLPNDPQGAFGARTFATSSKVSTLSDQFSVRIDHRISSKGQFFARFALNQVNGPLTNPSQTAIDPSFATRFFDHQRSGGFRYTRAATPNLISETSVGFIRSTPVFPSINSTQPGAIFGDGLYEPFNQVAGTWTGAYTLLYQVRQNFTYSRGAHAMKMGLEARFNHDSTVFGMDTNGAYTFGGGTSYSPVDIPSASGMHDIRAGEALPDTLSAFLTGAAFSYTRTVAPPFAPQGERIGEAAERRHAYNFYWQDEWKVSPRLSLDYGLRYEFNGLIGEAKNRAQNFLLVTPGGDSAYPWTPGAQVRYLFNPRPPYGRDWRGWGPRLTLAWRLTDHTVWRMGGAITTRLPNMFQENYIAGGSFPNIVMPYVTTAPGVPIAFNNSIQPMPLPPVYTTSGQAIFEEMATTAIPANTPLDLPRFQEEMAALTPGNELQPLTLYGMSHDLRNGYIGSYTAAVEHSFHDVDLSAAYVATAGIHLPSVQFVNGYPGASTGFAPFTQFNAQGQVVGGYSTVDFIASRSHSTYHALQASAGKTTAKGGLGYQVGYTLSKSLDDTSAVLGGSNGSSGPLLQSGPMDPAHPDRDKGPSTFDAAQVLTFSVVWAVPLDRFGAGHPLAGKLLSGWQILNISTLMSGPPFTVFSGVQQTGVGAGAADRPDQIARPVFSTGRPAREDYFGQGANNGQFFFIPIGIPGGTGPNLGRFGTLGRSTFRGPDFQDFDISVIKNTVFGHRGNAEAFTLQFRAEFFNVFNLVNFGLPMNVLRGTGFGIISKTAGPSRQAQFSLKLVF